MPENKPGSQESESAARLLSQIAVDFGSLGLKLEEYDRDEAELLERESAEEFTERHRRENQAAALANLELQNEDAANQIILRKTFSSRFFWLSVGWLVVISSLLYFQGFKLSLPRYVSPFELSDKVLIAAIAASSTVFAFSTIWATWLFQKGYSPYFSKPPNAAKLKKENESRRASVKKK
jgi:hypothetical protein